jgi:hypothetical protein
VRFPELHLQHNHPDGQMVDLSALVCFVEKIVMIPAHVGMTQMTEEWTSRLLEDHNISMRRHTVSKGFGNTLCHRQRLCSLLRAIDNMY